LPRLSDRVGLRLRAALVGASLAALLRPACAADPAPAAVRAPRGESPAKPEAEPGLDPMGQLSLGSGKEPILISADQLDFDWQNNKVVYRGKVHATQGDLVIDSDTLTINFLRPEGKGLGAEVGGRAAPKRTPGDAEAAGASRRSPTLRDVVAEGHVVITQKGRRATGGIAIFSQQLRQLVLGGDPVLRDGPNEVTGDRIVVYVDEGRSVVESSGTKRVSAVLHPGSEKGLEPGDKARDTAGREEKR
jgi:lipopolysaccharide export system protein LptA